MRCSVVEETIIGYVPQEVPESAGTSYKLITFAILSNAPGDCCGTSKV